MNILKIHDVITDKIYYININTVEQYYYNEETNVTTICTSPSVHAVQGDKTKELTKILAAGGRIATLE